MSRRWYRKLLLSYLPIFFMIVSLLAIIFFLAVGDLSRKQARQANDVFARHVAQAIEHSLRSIDQTLIKDIQTETFRRFFFREDNAYLAAYELSEKLRTIVVNTPYVDSMYAYRLSDRMILSPNTMVPLEQFGDREFIESVVRDGIPGRWTERRPFSELPEREQARPVVSLVHKAPILSGSAGFVVVNVRVDSLKKLIDDMSGIGISYVNVFAPGGGYVTGSARPDGQGNVSQPSSGIELSQLESPYTGWTIRSGLKNATAGELFSAFSIVWPFLGLAVVLAGAVIIFYVTGRHYRPIQSVLARIHTYSVQKSSQLLGKSSGDEFAFIEMSLDKLMEQANKYEKRFEEDLLIRRKHLFQELLDGHRAFVPEEWADEAALRPLSGGSDRWGIAIAEMDKYAEFCSRYDERDQYLLKHVLNSVLHEIAQSMNGSVWAEWLSNSRIGILYGWQASMQTEEVIVRHCEQVKDWLEANVTFTVTFGIGTTVSRIADLPLSYADAQEALNYRPALGGNRLIRYGELGRGGSGGSGFEHLHHIHRMAHEFRIGQRQWRDSFDEMFRRMRSSVIPRDDIVHLANYFVYSFSREIGRLPESYQDIWSRTVLPRLTEALEGSDTLEEIEARFRKALDDGANQMDALRETKSGHAISREVRQYIEERYANPDLSLDHLSEVFGFTGSYLSRLFREEFGERFVDYLMKVRIENAKTMLRDTSLPVQEIGRQVGYTHAISFIRTFKKAVGMTPGEYRR
ncbi:helix-turn-helix domain-containing protein [Paenibacillus flagellatus]|uniref:helix-turn-helix domain-containing protein n=1 Tax=Paenibacillus flagellatus TaxID=2211139 RepID=UPI0013051DDD|nr:helix-turn-helix domain-containing protein [Paenibacillus flagellatus]